MKTETQNGLIKIWLLNGYTITQLDALKMFGCFRLSARISDLKDQGFDIVTKMVKVNDKRVAQYCLKN
jgi:hypothetical protein